MFDISILEGCYAYVQCIFNDLINILKGNPIFKKKGKNVEVNYKILDKVKQLNILAYILNLHYSPKYLN